MNPPVKGHTMIANALNDRVARLAHEAREKDRERVQRGLNALVPVDLVEAEFDRAHGKTRSVGQRHTKTTREAVAEANEISLHRQTGVEKARRLT